MLATPLPVKPKGYEYQGFYINPNMVASLEAYIREGRRPGDFLVAVLSNDLILAAGRADRESKINLVAYAAYVYNEAPAECCGSQEAVDKWIEAGGARGIAENQAQALGREA